jgi:hypothetical protein
MPFVVCPLEDIEIVNLERVGFDLKNFDMAIVFKVRSGGPGLGAPWLAACLGACWACWACWARRVELLHWGACLAACLAGLWIGCAAGCLALLASPPPPHHHSPPPPPPPLTIHHSPLTTHHLTTSPPHTHPCRTSPRT